MTAEKAIAIAGGFSPRAYKSKVELTRNAPGQHDQRPGAAELSAAARRHRQGEGAVVLLRSSSGAKCGSHDAETVLGAHSAPPKGRSIVTRPDQPTSISKLELALLLALATLWGASYTFIKIGVATIPPVTLIAARTLIAGGILLAVHALARADAAARRPTGGASSFRPASTASSRSR